MKKFAIVYNTATENFEAYHYNLLYKIFGATVLSYYELSYSLEILKEHIDRRMTKKYKLIEIYEYKPKDNNE